MDNFEVLKVGKQVLDNFEDLKVRVSFQVYFAVAILLLVAGGIIVAKINMEPGSGR